MKAERDRVVRFHYDLSDAQGERLESSRDGEGIAILLGYRNVIPGVETALSGKRRVTRSRPRCPPRLATACDVKI